MNSFDGPGPGEPISRRDLRELAQGLNDQADMYGAVGINRDDTLGPSVDSIPQPQRCNARIIDGENPYSWEEVQQITHDDGTVDWLATGPRGGTQDVVPLYERNDESDLASGTIVEAQLDEATGNWLFTKPPASVLKKAILTRRNGTDYGWYFDGDTHPTGIVPVAASLAHTQTGDAVYPDIYTLTFLHDDTFLAGVTGSFTVTEGGGSPATITVADVVALLTGGTLPLSLFTYVFTPHNDGPSKLVFTAISAGTTSLTFDGTNLGPKTAKCPASFRNDTPMSVSVKVWVFQTEGAKHSVRVTTKQTADSTAGKHAIYVLKLKNATVGQYRFWFDGTGNGSEGSGTNGWVRLNWNDDATAIQTTLSTLLTCTVSEIDPGVFEVTVTADYSNHNPQVDRTNSLTPAEQLGGTQKYGIVWSNGTPCTAPFGGVDPTTITGFFSAGDWPAPTLTSFTINGGDPSTPAEWNISWTNFDSGSFSFGMDGNPATAIRKYHADGTWTPAIDGSEPWTVTVSGTGMHVTMKTNGAHTLDLYPGGMRGRTDIPDQVLFLNGATGCAKFAARDSISTRTAFQIPYTATDVIGGWSGVPPGDVGGALDRVGSAVGPIP